MNSYENERDFRLKLDNKKLSIDEKYFGFIVGKNGSIVKGIQTTTGTQIQFLNNSGKISNWCRQLARWLASGRHNIFLGLKAFEVIIRGPKKGIELAEKRIHQIVNSKAKEIEFETWLESVGIRLGFIP